MTLRSFDRLRQVRTALGFPHRARDLVAIAGILASAFFACDSDPTSPGPPGELHALLASPVGPEGAAVLQLTGPGLGNVTALDGQLYSGQRDGTLRVVIVLDEPGQIEFRLAVDNVRAVPAATVIEVSDANDQLRGPLSEYEVEFSIAERF